jgi:hypothetical protein
MALICCSIDAILNPNTTDLSVPLAASRGTTACTTDVQWLALHTVRAAGGARVWPQLLLCDHASLASQLCAVLQHLTTMLASSCAFTQLCMTAGPTRGCTHSPGAVQLHLGLAHTPGQRATHRWAGRGHWPGSCCVGISSAATWHATVRPASS